MQNDTQITIKELATYCAARNIECLKCEHIDVCERLQEDLNEISPAGLVAMIENNEIV